MQIKNIPFLYGLTCKIGNKLYIYTSKTYIQSINGIK